MTIKTFEEIGLLDPELEKSKAIIKTTKYLESISLESFVYPSSSMVVLCPPQCIFVPSKKVIRCLIKKAAGLCQEIIKRKK
jgi:hypothetical protein